MPDFHLAQINVALAKADLDHPSMAGFVDQIAAMNRLAETSPGFIWRLVADSGDDLPIRPHHDPLVLINISLWRDAESLQNYVYKTPHMAVIRARHDWFHKMPEAQQALWWVPAEHLPTVAEAMARLETLRSHGPSPAAFTFSRQFPPPA